MDLSENIEELRKVHADLQCLKNRMGLASGLWDDVHQIMDRLERAIEAFPNRDVYAGDD